MRLSAHIPGAIRDRAVSTFERIKSVNNQRGSSTAGEALGVVGGVLLLGGVAAAFVGCNVVENNAVREDAPVKAAMCADPSIGTYAGKPANYNQNLAEIYCKDGRSMQVAVQYGSDRRGYDRVYDVNGNLTDYYLNGNDIQSFPSING